MSLRYIYIHFMLVKNMIKSSGNSSLNQSIVTKVYQQVPQTVFIIFLDFKCIVMKYSWAQLSNTLTSKELHVKTVNIKN